MRPCNNTKTLQTTIMRNACKTCRDQMRSNRSVKKKDVFATLTTPLPVIQSGIPKNVEEYWLWICTKRGENMNGSSGRKIGKNIK